MTSSPSIATAVKPSGPGVHRSCACSAVMSSGYAYVSPSVTMSRKNGQICNQSSGRAARISTPHTVGPGCYALGPVVAASPESTTCALTARGGAARCAVLGRVDSTFSP